MIKIFFPAIPFFIALLLQIILIPLISLDGIQPDLILILIVFFTLRNGQIYGTVLGFVYGLIFDLVTGGMLGSSMFTKTLVGFIAGYFYNENKIDVNIKSYSFILIVLICSLVNSIIYNLISSFDLNTNIFGLIFQQGLLPSLFTAAVSSLIILFYPKRSYY